ncbi:MAG: EAL domain-containing protein [Vulcanococcus sp.]
MISLAQPEGNAHGIGSELRPDELKIDRSFVTAVERDPYAHHIVLVITNLARSLDIDLVGEGVEDRSTWNTLEQLGVDRFQGYLVSPPCHWGQISGLASCGRTVGTGLNPGQPPR